MKKILALALTLCLVCTLILAGCAGGITVTLMDGETQLDTVSVREGEAAVIEDPVKEGYAFMGWYVTPTLSRAYRGEAITEETTLYAGFVEHKADNRTFAIVGNGLSELLSASSWGNVINDEHYLTYDGSNGKNVYTITLDLLEGDQFQFAIDTSWANQRGAGYLTTVSYDGVECFDNGGGIGEVSAKKANILVKQSGNYTLTLTTYPAADYYDTEDAYYTEEGREGFNLNPFDTITFVRNGDAEGGSSIEKIDYYIKGAVITNWEDRYDAQYKMTEDNGVYTLTIDLEAGDEFLFTSIFTIEGAESTGNLYLRYTNIADDASKALVSNTDSQNIVAPEAGTYTFVYDSNSETLTVSK